MSQPAKPARSMSTALIVAIIALILGIASLGYGYYVQTQVSSAQSAATSLPKINQAVQTRNVTIDWVNTFNSGLDRFAPEYIVINQGDTVNLSFISNDTDAHTFTVILPTGTFQLNDSIAGQTNFLTGGTFAGNATGCQRDSVAVSCNLATYSRCVDGTGAKVACNSTAPPADHSMVFTSGSFTVKVAGTYLFYCVYHKAKGMFGYLIVLPNAGFTG
jgi:plastocyanin